ncbi:MAG: Hpt domain-containing protein, partial [Magnetospirillum sp.]
MDIRERLLAAFQVEYQEHLEVIRKLLAEMLARADGGSGIAQLDEIFRRAHSLKGAARAVDLGPVEQMAHRLETLFARMRSGHVKIAPDLASLIGRSLDMIEDWVSAFAGGHATPDVEPALERLQVFLETGEVIALRQVAPPVVDVPPELDQAVAAAAMPTVPPVASPPMTETVEAPRTAIAAEESVRVRAIHLDRLLRTSDELLTETMNQRAVTETLFSLDR